MPSMTEPSVSVIIPTFNRASLASRAVASALAAIAPGDEIVVIDDGSSDDTATQLEVAFGDQIRIVRTPNNGAGAARNRGIAEARCPLIAFLDSDDEWFPIKLYLQRCVMAAHPNIVGCFSDFRMKDREGGEHSGWMKNWCDYGQAWQVVLGPPLPFSSFALLPKGHADFDVYIGDLYPWLLEGNPIATSTLMMRSSVVRSSVRFAENVPTFEDLWCFASLARVGRLALLGCETAWNNGHGGPRLTNSSSALTCVSLRLRLLEEFWGCDAQFLARDCARYERIRSALSLELVTLLIYEGRMVEARALLRGLPNASFSHRTIAKLPGLAARSVLRARRWLRGGARGMAQAFQTAGPALERSA